MIAEAPAGPLALDRQRRAVGFDLELVEFRLRPGGADRKAVALADRHVIGARGLDAGEATERPTLAARRPRIGGARLAAAVSAIAVAVGAAASARRRQHQRQDRHRPVSHRHISCVYYPYNTGARHLSSQRATAAALRTLVATFAVHARKDVVLGKDVSDSFNTGGRGNIK